MRLRWGRFTAIQSGSNEADAFWRLECGTTTSAPPSGDTRSNEADAFWRLEYDYTGTGQAVLRGIQ